MYLHPWLERIGASREFRGDASATLASRVNAVTPTRPYASVPILDGSVIVRPIDILLELALATQQPQIHPSLSQMNLAWGVLRYASIFGPLPRLGLSREASFIVGNQRRVLSEDLGIGIAAILSRRWLTASIPTTVQIVDVDVALKDEDLPLVQTGANRPDYLLLERLPKQSGLQAVNVGLGLLECKGTGSVSYANKQLSRAARQLAGVEWPIDLPGLVTAAVIKAKSIDYKALQTKKQRNHQLNEPRRRNHTFDLVEPANPPEFEETGELLDNPSRLPRFVVDDAALLEAQGIAPNSPDRMALSRIAAAAFTSAAASLASYAGSPATERWLPRRAREQRGAVPLPTSAQRGPLQTRDGQEIRGVSSRVSIAGQQLEVIFAVDAAVDHALEVGTAESITAAQDAILSQDESQPVFSETSEVIARSPTGAVLIIRSY